MEKRIAVPDDREEFDHRFTDTNRTTATPRPGLSVARRWPMSDAEGLDASGKLVVQVSEAFKRINRELGP